MVEIEGEVVQPLELVLPIMTTTARNAMSNREGLVIFNTTTNKINFNTGSGWEAVTSA
tara:strand:- start:292 stop:465 length:174 start_codon:yes stop_codon:yes gene_type:complete